MEQEKILSIIDKLVDAKITIDELQQIVSLLETPDFVETFQIVENIEAAIKPMGRVELKNELKLASQEYHKEVKVIKLQNIKNWTFPAIAACLLVVVGISTLTNIRSHSDKDIYYSHSGGGAAYKINQNPEIK